MKDYITLIGDRIRWLKEPKGSLAYRWGGFARVLAVLLSKGCISYFVKSGSAIAIVAFAAFITLSEVSPRSVASAELISGGL